MSLEEEAEVVVVVLLSLEAEVLLQELLRLHGVHSTLVHRDIAIYLIFCANRTVVFA